MSSKRAKKKVAIQQGSYQKVPKQFRPILAVVLLVLSVLHLVAMLDYLPTQNEYITTEAARSRPNLVGDLGVYLTYWSFYVFGKISWFLPLWGLYVSYLCLARKGDQVRWMTLLAVVMMLLTGAPLFTRFSPEVNDFFVKGGGGVVGSFLYEDLLREPIGAFGATFLLAVLFVAFLAFFFVRDFKVLGLLLKQRGALLLQQWRESREEAALAKVARREKQVQEKEAARVQKQEEAQRKKEEAAQLKADEKAARLAEKKAAQEAKRASKLAAEEVKEEEAEAKPSPAAKRAVPRKQEAAETEGSVKVVKEEVVEKADFQLPEIRGSYKFPPLKILSEPVVASEDDQEEDFQETAERLKGTLAEFKLQVELGEVHQGPVITRYEITPAPGVRVEKIANLDKNIAMSLRASGVRILAPVPGKGCVGVEVPNSKPLPVCIRDILESKHWANTKAEIPLALGKEVSGRPLVADLTKMPHLLIAGSTGSGKTVCINSIITSLLFHASPDDLRFIMVDPKIVEMQVYNKLPHMLIPVVTEPKKVPGALKWLLNEMERRYHIFAKKGVRNIAGFNAKQAKDAEAEQVEREMAATMTAEERAAVDNIQVPRDESIAVPKKLPYIVCIVDELADLMMVAPADIETGIARLAQLARAAGIHLIIATQRPSVNVITGVIKANLPSRISFKVASKVDSRTILDAGGADALIGKGDMLMIPPGTSDLVRGQGAFVSDDEITDIVEYLHEQNGGPRFAESVQAEIDAANSEDGGSSDDDGSFEDDMVPRAIEVIKATKRASTSMLQRKLKIGYNRAARIMDILEDEGMIGPENGSTPREIFLDVD